MKSTIRMFLVMLLVAMVAGCGSEKTTTVYVPISAQNASDNGTLTFASKKSQILKLALDEKGNVKNLRDGGIRVKPSSGDSVVFSSYRFGDYKSSPYRIDINSSMNFVFLDFPNSDQWGDYWYVQASGRKFKIQIAEFAVVELPGLYYWIDPSSSSIEWGEIEADSAQDGMKISINESTMLATINWQAGCDLIFATKAGIFDFKPGMSFGIKDGFGRTYSGNIIQDVDGNLSASVGGIPVVPGPYYNRYDGNPIPVATIISDIFITLPNGYNVSLNTRANTPNDEDEAIYVWYIQSDYDTPNNAQFWVNQGDGLMTINYQPASR